MKMRDCPFECRTVDTYALYKRTGYVIIILSHIFQVVKV